MEIGSEGLVILVLILICFYCSYSSAMYDCECEHCGKLCMNASISYF